MGGFKFETTTQPGGLRESSRWSKRSEDHRLGQARRWHPDGVPDEKRKQSSLLAPLRGCNFFLICSGGFRFAATTGYCLPALQADLQVLKSRIKIKSTKCALRSGK